MLFAWLQLSPAKEVVPYLDLAGHKRSSSVCRCMSTHCPSAPVGLSIRKTQPRDSDQVHAVRVEVWVHMQTSQEAMQGL